MTRTTSGDKNAFHNHQRKLKEDSQCIEGDRPLQEPTIKRGAGQDRAPQLSLAKATEKNDSDIMPAGRPEVTTAWQNPLF